MRHRLNQHKLNAILMRNVRVFMIGAVMVIIGICMPVDQLYLALIAHGFNQVVLFENVYPIVRSTRAIKLYLDYARYVLVVTSFDF